jgi:hypothetical protein
MKKKFILGIFILIALAGCNKDTTLTSSNNRPPNPPANPAPMNGAVNVSGSVTLSWYGVDPDPGDSVSFDVNYGYTTATSSLLIANTQNTSAVLGILAPNTTVYWRITAKDSFGATNESPLWSFTTAP